MNSVWFEDFVTLAESAGFSRAAELRFISQPSLSRRIQSLEEWIGVVLIDRRTHTFRLTPAGEVFLPLAVDLLRQINHARTMAQDAGGTSEQKLRFAATHVLSMTFFPQWLRSLERDQPLSATIELTADHVVACEALMMDGRAVPDLPQSPRNADGPAEVVPVASDRHGYPDPCRRSGNDRKVRRR